MKEVGAATASASISQCQWRCWLLPMPLQQAPPPPHPPLPEPLPLPQAMGRRRVARPLTQRNTLLSSTPHLPRAHRTVPVSALFEFVPGVGQREKQKQKGTGEKQDAAPARFLGSRHEVPGADKYLSGSFWTAHCVWLGRPHRTRHMRLTSHDSRGFNQKMQRHSLNQRPEEIPSKKWERHLQPAKGPCLHIPPPSHPVTRRA